ncbi:E3 ubiquitin ligase family protein [Almyronema epifaneia]|uniref:RING-type E3 ubiquitin transferase n=1 Tax=Almyronema epifaneia S1 TaxID=2991925 RepID=A0ABW6IJV4_9CYAN
MNAWIVIGIILLIVGLTLFFVRRNQQARAFSLKSARRVTVAELGNTAQAIADEIGGGNWRDYVKLWGEIEVAQPLISELKQVPCVYYSFKVQREYEETVTEKDAEGNTTHKTEQRSETVASNQQSTLFYLQDETGKIWVDPNEAAIEAVQVLNEFRPGDPAAGMLQMGRFSLTLGNSHRRTVGYRYTESVLPIDRKVLVVGEVSDHTGTLTLCRPTATKKKYIISLKTDEVLTANADQGAKNAAIAMFICLGLGILLILVGILL